MNKKELVSILCDRTLFHTKVAKEIVEALLDVITESVHSHKSISIQGFGSFFACKKRQRNCSNPTTGKTMVIPERTIFKFRPSKKIKIIKSI